MLLAVAFTSSLRASPPIGAVVQGSPHYDAARQVVTVNLLNTSHKDISAYSMRVLVTRADGTISAREYGGDFLPHMAETDGEGAFAPGASIAIDVPVGQEKIQTASATVDVVVYTDDTADVLNEMVYKSIVAGRGGSTIGLQKANELLQAALADPNDPHPSITVAAKLKALAKQYQTNPPKGEEEAGSGMQLAATNISNAPKSPTGRSDKEDGWLRAIIKRQQQQIALILPHTQLKKGVQP